MIPKSGDLSDIPNWRSITILPILYKDFSKILHHRIRGILDSHQSDEQISFRNNFRLEDKFLIYESLIANSLEFNIPI